MHNSSTNSTDWLALTRGAMSTERLAAAGNVLSALHVPTLSPQDVLDIGGFSALKRVGEFVFDSAGARVSAQDAGAAAPPEEEEDEMPVPCSEGEPEPDPEQPEALDPAPAAKKVPWCKDCRHVGHERRGKLKCPMHPDYVGEDKGKIGTFANRPSWEVYQEHLKATARVPQAPDQSSFDGEGWRIGAADWTPEKCTAPAFTQPKAEFGFNLDTEPIEYFRQFATPSLSLDLVRWTNEYISSTPELREIPFYTPLFAKGTFDVTLRHLDALCGTYILNGLHPYPSMDFYWDPDKQTFGDTLISDTWSRLGGRRAFHFLKKTLRFNDPGVVAEARQAGGKLRPFMLVQPIIDSLREQCESTCTLGRDMSLDEIDVGFQGRFAGASRIKYKREGDGVLLDAIACAETAYLFTFWPRADPLLPGPRVDALPTDLSPLGRRCLFMLGHRGVAKAWRHVYCDNLFTSLKFGYYVHSCTSTYLTGVCRMSGRGLPKEVKQPELKESAARAAKGTVKIAHLNLGSFCALAVSVYDSKPVHVLTTAHAAAEMLKHTRTVVVDGQKVEVQFDRLDLISKYNNYMNGVDRTDQMRFYYDLAGPYQRHKKWTWAIFIWTQQQSVVQAYAVYKMVVGAAERSWEERVARAKQRHGEGAAGKEALRRLPPRPRLKSHLQFQKEIGLALLAASSAIPAPVQLRRSPRKQAARAKRASVEEYVDATKRRKAAPDFQVGLTKGGRTLDSSNRIPGDHPLMSRDGQSQRCYVCMQHTRLYPGKTSNSGKYFNRVKNKYQKTPPKARFFCPNPVCGSRSFCSPQCWNAWHYP